MDVDKAREILKRTNTDHFINNRIVCGLEILSEFFEDGLKLRFKHVQTWVQASIGGFEETVKKMNEDTVKMMAKLGWFESEDAWSHFS